MDKKEKKSLPEPRTYTVEQIAAMLNIGRTTAYQLVKQEEFKANGYIPVCAEPYGRCAMTSFQVRRTGPL